MPANPMIATTTMAAFSSSWPSDAGAAGLVFVGAPGTGAGTAAGVEPVWLVWGPFALAPFFRCSRRGSHLNPRPLVATRSLLLYPL
jgi:hypothetical protein